MNKFKIGDKVKVPKSKTSHWNDYLVFAKELKDKNYTKGYLIIKNFYSYNGKDVAGLEFDSHGSTLRSDCFSINDLELYEEQVMNKKFKNQLAISGSKHLLQAFGEELKELGYTGHLGNDTINSDHRKYLQVNQYQGVGTYGFWANKTHDDCKSIELELPKDWDEALQLAKEEAEEKKKRIEGKWYKNLTFPKAIIRYSKSGIDMGTCTSGTWGDKLGCGSEESIEGWVEATEEEIKQTLIKGATSKGLVEGITFNSASKSGGKVDYRLEGNPYYSSSDDTLWNSTGAGRIYWDGLWAEIVESTPDITVNGYKATFKEYHVEFGCAKFSITTFRLVLDLHDHMSSNCLTNRSLDSIKLGDGTFTIEQVKEILDYYNKK